MARGTGEGTMGAADPARVPPSGPDRMRQAVAEYVAGIHEAYVRQSRTLPPAAQAAMPLLADAPLHVAAVGTRHLHVIATREPLGAGQRGTLASVSGEAGPLHWTLSFYDPVVIPGLGLVDERDGPAFDEVRRLLGVSTHVYHLTLSPQSGLSAHHAGHTGTGLANAHAIGVRELQAIERAAPGRASLVRELAGALAAGLPRAATLVARELAPDSAEVADLATTAAAGADVDAAEVRRAVLRAVRGEAGVAE